MASFPTTNKTFAARSNGQTIDASHVGDLQDEVAAIEDGYLNGTARLNSSNSTAVTLSVSGGSTLAALHVTSTASFDSSVTFTGAVTISGALTAVNNFPGAKVSVTSSQTVGASASTWSAISWDAEQYDAAGLHSTASNSSRINLTSSGTWAFGGQVIWAVDSITSTGTCHVRVMASDTNVISVNGQQMAVTSTVTFAQSVQGIHYASDTTAFLVLSAQRTPSGTIGLSSGTSTSAYGVTHFWVQKVSN